MLPMSTLSHPKKSARTAAVTVIRTLHRFGHEAYFAGGCVRDQLIGRKPKDYDVATSARPDEVERYFRRTISVGKAFGVIRVREGECEVEVATFRNDGTYLDGRRPSSIQFTSACEDAQRRDFTINGLFEDPILRKIVDYVGGRIDLNQRIIRAIGNPEKRFQEDHLRLLRAVRFTSQLGFRIDPATWKAIKKMAPKIRSISSERVRDELTKLLTAPHAAQGLRFLQRSSLMKYLLPDIEAMRGVAQPRAFHPEGDVFIHTLKVISHLHAPSPRLAWAALLHDVGKPITFEKSKARGRIRIRFPEHARVGAELADRILQQFRFSNSDREAIVQMVANHMTFKDVKAMRPATLKRLLARPTFDEELALHRADCLGCHGLLTNIHFLKRKQKEFSKEEIRPPRLISGKDLISLGLLPGPAFGNILAAVEEAQLEGDVKSRQQALDFVVKMGKTRKLHA